VESIDLSPSFGCKGGMLFDGVWMISINPEDRIIETIADAVSPRIIGHLHHSAHTKRPQGGVIERGGTADVCDPNAGVVNHFAPQSMLISSNFEGDNVAVMHGWITLHVGNCTWSERCQEPTVDHRVCSNGQISTTPEVTAQGVCDTIFIASAIVAASIRAKPATGSVETIYGPSFTWRWEAS
jgi:hypothetical protein